MVQRAADIDIQQQIQNGIAVRLPDMRIHDVGCHDGRINAADYSADARPSITVIKHTRHGDNGFILSICIHHVKWNNSYHTAYQPQRPLRRDRISTDCEPYHHVSCSISPYDRNFCRRRVGKCFMGKILGLGP